MEVSERISVAEARIEALEDQFIKHEEKQNGHMLRIEAKVDRIYMWLIGLMGGVITALILLIVSMAKGG